MEHITSTVNLDIIQITGQLYRRCGTNGVDTWIGGTNSFNVWAGGVTNVIVAK